jgi:hypothetical protein
MSIAFGDLAAAGADHTTKHHAAAVEASAKARVICQ